MLTDDPEGEPVSISSLDEEDRAHHWPSPDFVKIDVEGEELRVIEGGRVFFARYSPLIMFEMKAGRQVNHAIAETFRALGYRIFRLLPGAPLLVPVEAGDVLDQSELNLFAAKPDRAAALAREGRLVEEVSAWHPDDAARAKALEAIAARPFGPSLSRLSAPPLRSDYRDALAGYATWASPDVPSSVRYAALRFSSNLLNDLCHSQPQLGRLSTFARASWALGERRLAIAALQKLLEIEEQTPCITEPFWPASRRFDSLNPGDDVPTWFLVSTAEQLERISGYSSVFPGSRVNLEWLRGQRLVSTEIERRYVLKKARVGERVAVPQRLCRQAEDHINFDTWRSGLVPNTFVAGA
jgi:hypothetical protein